MFLKFCIFPNTAVHIARTSDACLAKAAGRP
jgi:hypothetical protein